MTSYHIEIERRDDNDAGQNETFASAFGDLDEVSYIAKRAVKKIEDEKGNFVLLLAETDGIGGQTVREVVSLVAGSRVVSTVLKGELTSERKASKTVSESAPAPDQEDGFDETYPAGTQTDTNDPNY